MYLTIQFLPDILVFTLIPFTIIGYMISGYYVILAPGKLYNTLVSEDWNQFRGEMVKFLMVATVVLCIKVLRGILRESSANLLRLRLTSAIHNFYFADSGRTGDYSTPPYYRLISEETADNPDQRIVTDVRDFSVSLFDILAGGRSQGQDSGGLLEAAASLLFYSNKTLLRTGWYGILVAYVWSFLVSLITVFVINRTSPVVFRQEKLEADFRYCHAEFRQHAEEVALMRGAAFEHRKLTGNLERAVSNTWSVILRHIFLNFVQYGFAYYISLIMYLTLALAIHSNVFEASNVAFSSTMTPGEKAQWISQTGGIFMQLLFSFTMFVQLGTIGSEFVSYVNRISVLIDSLEEESAIRQRPADNPDTEPLMLAVSEEAQGYARGPSSDAIRIQNLEVQPGGVRTVGPVSFTLQKGQWLLLDGRTGSGKTSVVKVLRGLWSPSSGTVEMPNDQHSVMFVPQKPYISPGICSLRELVTYPEQCRGTIEEINRVSTALQEVGWRRGLHGQSLDFRTEWSRQLSPGETQLIAASRVVFHGPSFVILDEPTASLDVTSEARVMRALRRAGVSALTVGHSPSLRQLHDGIIFLEQR